MPEQPDRPIISGKQHKSVLLSALPSVLSIEWPSCTSTKVVLHQSSFLFTILSRYLQKPFKGDPISLLIPINQADGSYIFHAYDWWVNLRAYQCYYMINHSQMADIIRSSGMGVDNYTLDATLNFLDTHVGLLPANSAQYQLLAATAIMGETIVLDDISNTRRARSGITIEHVLRHAGRLSKEQLLQVITRQVAKWREAPLWLKAKTDKVKLSYRVYKKYRAVFDELCPSNTLLDQQSRFNLMAIFWVLFLFIKNQNAEFENVMDSNGLLHAIVVFVFAEVSAQLQPRQASAAFRRQFPQSLMPIEAEMERMKGIMMERLNETHVYRYQGCELEVQRLATESNFSQRYLDDMSNLYDRFKAALPETTIDEISFLELTRNLTPQSIKRNSFTACIQKKIDFTKDDDDDEDDEGYGRENDPPKENADDVAMKAAELKLKLQQAARRQPLSPFKPHISMKGALTPVSARHQNLAWINSITAKFTKEDGSKVRAIYQKYTSRDYKAYQSKALNNITDAISQFTPECMDFPKRQLSIYHFFEHFINRIAQSHGEAQLGAIFGQDCSFNSILCLTADLFNFAYQSLSGSYRKYCRIFGVTLLEGHKPINWFGKHIAMPNNIENYLYQLERKILIEEVWEDNEGYRLLSNEEELKKYHNQALLRRLMKHADERTQELCQKMNIQARQVARTVNLVRFIIEKRPLLLKNHRIDQIIVCAIASLLSINRSRNHFTLEEVFQHYNQLILSYYANRHSLYDSDGNQLGLIDFYNSVFLPSVEDIINNEEHAAILATPVRLQRRKSKDMGIELTPIPKKFKQAPLIISSRKLFHKDGETSNDQIGGNKTLSYRSALASSLKNLDSFAEQDEEDYPSPSFGGNNAMRGYNRTFSFADLPEK